MATVNLPPLTFTFGPYRLDHETGQLHHGDRVVSLQPRPLAVLRALLEAGGSLVTKEDLVDRVWDGAFIEDSNITKCVAEIRQALRAGFRGEDPVMTVWKQGYRFVAPISITAPNPTPSIARFEAAKPVEIVVPAAAQPNPPTPVVEPPGSKPGWVRWGAIALAAGLASGLALLIQTPKAMSKAVAPATQSAAAGPTAMVTQPTAAARPDLEPASSAAMLGVHNISSEPRADWMARLLVEALRSELQSSTNLRVISASEAGRTVRSFDMDITGAWELPPLRQAASQLNVDCAITGTYRVAGGNIRLELHLTGAKPGSDRGTVVETGSPDTLLDLIARTGVAVRQALGQNGSLLAPNVPQPRSGEVLHLYAEALERQHAHDGRGAEILLCRARKMAPDYTAVRRSLLRLHHLDGDPVEVKNAAIPGKDSDSCPIDTGERLPALPPPSGPKPGRGESGG
jgi:DNA-binding winged helix-turn-helix (wHTH) protein/TolB-like protein